jgi:hypothetical protein
MRGENFMAHLDGLGGTPVAHHWFKVSFELLPEEIWKEQNAIHGARLQDAKYETFVCESVVSTFWFTIILRFSEHFRIIMESAKSQVKFTSQYNAVSGDQPCQYGMRFQRFENCLRLRYQRLHIEDIMHQGRINIYA